MHVAGIGAVYGPQLPCCPNATTATAGALESGLPCDPNCLEGDAQAGVLARMQAAIDDLTARSYLGTGQETQQQATSTQWFPGVSNAAVIAVGVGLGVILLLGRRR